MKYHFYVNQLSNAQLAGKIGVNPYFLKQYEQASRFYSKGKLAKIFSYLRQYDLMSKGVNNRSVKDNEILNEGGLRNSKEFVNHKILDCIGDLFTSGYRIIGSINCSRGGHFLTNELLKRVFNDNANFSLIEIKERNLPHTLINRSLLKSIA